MARFMAVYTGAPGAQMPDEQTIAKGMAAWQAWMQDHAGQIVDGGGPLGKTKRVTKGGIADSRNNIAAYVVVEAADQDAAARMFENHPHFAIFPGDGVDVMPCLPIPSRVDSNFNELTKFVDGSAPAPPSRRQPSPVKLNPS